MRRESWDTYGSIDWPTARMATGYDLASARLLALNILARKGLLSTGTDENACGWRESNEDMPVVAWARAFLPEMAI